MLRTNTTKASVFPYVFLTSLLCISTIANADILAKSGYESGKDGVILLTEKCKADATGQLKTAVSRIGNTVLEGCYVINNRGNAIVKWSNGSVQELTWKMFGKEKLSDQSTRVSSRYSPWEFFSDKTTAGTPVCGMWSASLDKNNVRNASVKQLANRDQMSLTLFNDRWNFKQGTSIDITIDFMDNQPIKLPAYADGKILDIDVPKQITHTFLSVMKDSKAIQFKVVGGPDWGIPLQNMEKPLISFTKCAISLNGKSAGR
ncbi:hypothetical protein ACO0LL_02250 [Undibacterium sp. TC4M20W]|uniref:hypothetical protein n=1 Tax=Undibacterium sp. TC4M20W TaxID=3413052 RepID=UPI003BEFC39D